MWARGGPQAWMDTSATPGSGGGTCTQVQRRAECCSIFATRPPSLAASPRRAHPSMAGVAERQRTNSQLGHSMSLLSTTCRSLVGWTGRAPRQPGAPLDWGTGLLKWRTAPRCKWDPSPSACMQLVLWEGDGAGIALQLGINTVRPPCRHLEPLVLTATTRPAAQAVGQRANKNWRWQVLHCRGRRRISTTAVCGPWHTAGKEWPGGLAQSPSPATSVACNRSVLIKHPVVVVPLPMAVVCNQ